MFLLYLYANPTNIATSIEIGIVINTKVQISVVLKKLASAHFETSSRYIVHISPFATKRTSENQRLYFVVRFIIFFEESIFKI
jgi:hypothetical protein